MTVFDFVRINPKTKKNKKKLFRNQLHKGEN